MHGWLFLFHIILYYVVPRFSSASGHIIFCFLIKWDFQFLLSPLWQTPMNNLRWLWGDSCSMNQGTIQTRGYDQQQPSPPSFFNFQRHFMNSTTSIHAPWPCERDITSSTILICSSTLRYFTLTLAGAPSACMCNRLVSDWRLTWLMVPRMPKVAETTDVTKCLHVLLPVDRNSCFQGGSPVVVQPIHPK